MPVKQEPDASDSPAGNEEDTVPPATDTVVNEEDTAGDPIQEPTDTPAQEEEHPVEPAHENEAEGSQDVDEGSKASGRTRRSRRAPVSNDSDPSSDEEPKVKRWEHQRVKPLCRALFGIANVYMQSCFIYIANFYCAVHQEVRIATFS